MKTIDNINKHIHSITAEGLHVEWVNCVKFWNLKVAIRRSSVPYSKELFHILPQGSNIATERQNMKHIS